MHTATAAPPHAAVRSVHAAAHVGLRTAHLELRRSIAELDPGDARQWAHVDPVVVRIVTEAYAVTAALTGQAPVAPATGVSPLARLQELAAAQGRLFSELDRRDPPGAAVHRSVHVLRALHGRLHAGPPQR